MSDERGRVALPRRDFLLSHADYKVASGAKHTVFVLVPGTRGSEAVWRELFGKWRVERFGRLELISCLPWDGGGDPSRGRDHRSGWCGGQQGDRGAAARAPTAVGD